MFSRLIINELKIKHKLDLDLDKTNFINNFITSEYSNEFNGNQDI